MMYARSVTVGILLATFVMQIHASQGNKSIGNLLGGFVEEKTEEQVEMQNPLKPSYEPGYEMKMLREHIDELVANDNKKNKYGQKYLNADRDAEDEIEKMLDGIVKVFEMDVAQVFGKSEPDVKMFEPTKLWCGLSTFKILFEDETDPGFAIRLVVNSETMFWEVFQYQGECTESTSRWICNHMRQGLPNASKCKDVYQSFKYAFGLEKSKKVKWENPVYRNRDTDRAKNLYGDEILSGEPTLTHTLSGNDADIKSEIMTYIDGQVNLRFPVAGHGDKYWDVEWKPLPVPPTPKEL